MTLTSVTVKSKHKLLHAGGQLSDLVICRIVECILVLQNRHVLFLREERQLLTRLGGTHGLLGFPTQIDGRIGSNSASCCWQVVGCGDVG